MEPSEGRVRALLLGIILVFALSLMPSPVRADEEPSPWVFALPTQEQLTPDVLLRAFDPPDQPWLAGHRGVDLRAEEGSEVVAAGEGVVAFAGVVVDRPVVSVDHPIGVRTTYEPVIPAVSAGERVVRGGIIGHLHRGNGHCQQVCAQCSCLHWGARVGADRYIDPLRLLTPPKIRLFPPEPW